MNSIDYHELRERVRELKYKKRLTQHAIAQLLGVRNTYLSDMLNGRVPVTESVTKKIYELVSDKPQQEKDENETTILQQLLQEKEKTIALLKENAALLRKQVALLEEKIAFLEEERSKKIERAVSSRKSADTDAHAIFPHL